MTQVLLPSDRDSFEVALPDSTVVLLPKATETLPNPEAAVSQALQEPIGSAGLRHRVQPGQQIVIVVSDITRPVPNQIILPPVFAELNAAGIRDDHITIVVGTGLHRLMSPDELDWMLGVEMVRRYRVVQHEARRPETLVEVGRTRSGVPVSLCRTYVEADFRIMTGFVEPHLFAGYSGGAKGVMPGVAGAELIMHNHGFPHLSSSRARWCVTEGNPIFEQIEEVASLRPPEFLLNVTIDTDRQLTGVFAGEPGAAYKAAISQAERQYLVEIPGAFDIVVVTNMGYPADTTLYQCIKGVSVAAEAVRDQGAIILVAGCDEGLGGSEYVDLLTSGESPAALLAEIAAGDEARLDQWQVQCQAEVQEKARVYLRSKLSRQDTEAAHLDYCSDVSALVNELVKAAQAGGRPGSVLALPHGQLTVPVLA